ncbi:MAG: hypothetical protein ABIN89_19930 [Chitinophagaceae bacterium]
MSFANIHLPPSVIVEIYKNCLVEITKKNTKPIQYLGNNAQKLLVFVSYPGEVFLPGEQLEFLEKILLACKLNLGDIAIINVAKQPWKFEDYIESLVPKSILVFGTDIPISREYPEMIFFTTVYHQGITLMSAPALEKLNEENNESKQLKTRFWHSLKQFFSI